MDRQTLFTTLVRRFAAGRVEVLATAGLGYILEQSAECRQSLQALVDACGASVSADLDYRTQATGDDAAIPDLVGAPPGAGPELIIEGKFWAGLTANQPCTYLKRLQVGRPGCLLFVGPSARMETLWPKLKDACAACPPPLVPTQERREQPELRAITLESGHVLALASWRRVLGGFEAVARAADNRDLVTDILQLGALCDAQDEEGFAPLSQEELTDQRVARRLTHFSRLPADIVARAGREGVVDVRKLNPAATSVRFGNYCRIGPFGAFLAIDWGLWARYGHGPLWLLLQRWKETPTPEWDGLELRLAVLHEDRRLHGPHRVVLDNQTQIVLGLGLLVNAERDDVIADVVQQLRAVTGAVGAETLPLGTPPAAPITPDRAGEADR